MKNGLYIDIQGTKEWYKNGKLHREDGPAVIHSDGFKMWLIKGKLHREDGPAKIWPDGYCEYYLNSKQLTEEEFNNYKFINKINELFEEIELCIQN